MNCFEAQDKIIDLMLGELTAEDEFLLKEHLHGCPMCEEDFALLSECFQVCTHEEDETCECQFQAAYWDEFIVSVHEKVCHEKFERTFPFHIVLPVAASAIVAFSIGYYFFLMPKPQEIVKQNLPNHEKDPYEEVQELSPEETQKFIKMINQRYGGK